MARRRRLYALKRAASGLSRSKILRPDSIALLGLLGLLGLLCFLGLLGLLDRFDRAGTAVPRLTALGVGIAVLAARFLLMSVTEARIFPVSRCVPVELAA